MDSNNKLNRTLIIGILYFLPLLCLIAPLAELIDNFSFATIYGFILNFSLCFSSTIVATSCALFYVERYPKNENLSSHKTLYIASSLALYLIEFFALRGESISHLVLLIIFLLLSFFLSVFVTKDYFNLNAFVSLELKSASEAKKRSRKARGKKSDGELNLEDDIDE